MKALGIVFWFELKRTITKWSFWIRTLSVPIMIAVIFGISAFSNSTAINSTEQLSKNKFSVEIFDKSGLVTQQSIDALGGKVIYDKEGGIAGVKDNKVDAFIYFPADPSTSNIEIYAKDDGLMNNSKYSTAATNLLQASIASKLGSQTEVTLLQSSPKTTLVTYKNGEQTKGFGRVVAPALFLILFYIVIILLGNQMLTSVTEEKENRVVEMILTSVSSKHLIWGKIWALIVMGLLQIGVILIPILIAYFGWRSKLNIPSLDMSQISWAAGPILAGFMLLISGFITFTALLVAIGASVPSAKEASGYFGGVMILIFLPFYAIPAIISSPDQLIVKVLSYFPLSSPITLMIRNAVGNVSAVGLALGIIITIITGLLIMMLAVRIFKYGSLEYARKLSLREIFSAK